MENSLSGKCVKASAVEPLPPPPVKQSRATKAKASPDSFSISIPPMAKASSSNETGNVPVANLAAAINQTSLCDDMIDAETGKRGAILASERDAESKERDGPYKMARRKHSFRDSDALHERLHSGGIEHKNPSAPVQNNDPDEDDEANGLGLATDMNDDS